MNIIEIVLLAIVTFIFAIDQFSLTEIAYRPIVACPIIGLILVLLSDFVAKRLGEDGLI